MRHRIPANPNTIRIQTKFGSDLVRVRPIEPARHLLVVDERYVFPKRCRPAHLRELKDSERVLEEGMILFPRRDEETGVRRYDIYREGLFDAIRGRMHTLLGYGTRDSESGEQARVRLLRSTVVDVWALLAAYGHFKEGDREELVRNLSEVRVDLRRVRNRFKKQARDRIEVAVPFVAKNPGAARATLVATDRRLDERSREIPRIMPIIGYYELVLLNELDRVYGIFTELDSFLRTLVGPKGILREDPKKIERSRKGILARLSSVLDDVLSIRVEPFIFTRNILTIELAGAITALEGDLSRNAIDMAVTLLDRSLRSIQFRFVQRDLEDLRTELACAMAGNRVPNPAETERLNKKLEILLAKADRMLDERGFAVKPRTEFFDMLRLASLTLFAERSKEAKIHLAQASKILSRPQQ